MVEENENTERERVGGDKERLFIIRQCPYLVSGHHGDSLPWLYTTNICAGWPQTILQYSDV